MPDEITDNTPDDIQTPLESTWFEPLVKDKPEVAETLGKFESFDAFLEDYNGAKNRDWRAEIAGDDDKFKSQLERFSTPTDFGTSFREAQQKIRSGQLKADLPEDASEEQIKEFRRQNNIPLEPQGYLENLPEGLVVGEQDKEILLDVLGSLHQINADPKVAHSLIGWYNDFEEKQQESLAAMDAEQAREATDLLRDPEEGWGKDFRTNMNLVNSLLKTHFGEDASQQLLNGRYQDGRGFFNDVNVLKGLASLARQVNEVAPLIQQDPERMQSLHDEIATLEKYMKTSRSEYMKDEKAQARLRELYDLRLKSESANAA